jgi:deuterolysin
MMFLAHLVAVASLVVAAPTERADSVLDVKLESVGNTEIQATITNSGLDSLRLLKAGSIISHVPVQKVSVTSNSESLDFEGAKVHPSLFDLNDESFQDLGSSQSIQVVFDVAEMYNLSRGGLFNIASSGSISYAMANSTKIAGSLHFKANDIKLQVNGDEAGSARLAFRNKFRAIVTQCSGDKLGATQRGLSNCAVLARGAANAATNGPAAKMEEYFKSSSQATRNTVAANFNRVAQECGSSTSGLSRVYCSDPYNFCSGNLAYAVSWENYTAVCDSWFSSRWEDITKKCHMEDRANVLLHEMTHLDVLVGTDDLNCYGYQCVRSLTAAQNIKHADTYLFFANAIYAGC